MKKGNAKLVLIGLLAFTALAWLGLLKNQIDSSSAYRKYLEQGQRYEEKGIYIDALESYEKALELNSGSYDITMKLADMYYQVGDYTNSTNHTYVDGKMIQPNTEVPIQQGTKIRLGNEDFEFKLR